MKHALAGVRHLTPVAALLGVALLVLVGLAALFVPGIVLHGWLIAVTSVAAPALGCMAWLAIHALTGGRWGERGRPALLGGAAVLPLVFLLMLPVILADGRLFPWAADPNAAGPGVASLYLNTGFLALRSLVLLGGLSVAAWRARRGPLPVLLAGGTLVLYAGLMNLSAFDWLLSLDPHYTSSAFGMQIIVAQLLSALCVMVLATEAPADDPVWGDFGGLLLACLLGETYLILMTFVVHWYGNLPDQAAWYLRRSTGAWRWLEVGGVLVGAVLPGGALLFSRVRHGPGLLRAVSVAILAGILAEMVWLIAPESGGDAGWVIVAGVVALLGCCGLMVALARVGGAPAERVGKGVPHGA